MAKRLYACPGCGYEFDSFFQVGGNDYGPPEEGSLGICIHCEDMHTWEKDGEIRLLTPEEYLAVTTTNKEVQAALSALIQIKGE